MRSASWSSRPSLHLLTHLSRHRCHSAAYLARQLPWLAWQKRSMAETEYGNRLARLARAAKSTTLDAAGLHAQLSLLLPSQYATSQLAMLEDRVRQLEDAEGMLSEFCGMVSTDIDAMLVATSSSVHAAPSSLGPVVRTSSPGPNKLHGVAHPKQLATPIHAHPRMVGPVRPHSA